jgi:undecaprenyl-diphosphatase
MTTLQSIFLGILEGLTEFLPISSTGHLTLASHFLNILQDEKFITFEIAIQLGAILAVLVLFWRKFLDFEFLQKLAVAFIPTAVIGLILSKFLKTILTSEILIAINLIIGGIIIILVEKRYTKNFIKKEHTELELTSTNITFKQSFILGIAQALAIFPGVSRSGAVIVTGLFMNIGRKILTEFTFLLAVPTMSAATAYSLYKYRDILTTENLQNIFIGFTFAFIVALGVIKLFINYIKKYDFTLFGYYRIIFGLILLFILI